MSNYNQVLDAQAIAADSAGLATERYGIYMEGLEATANRFTATWEQLWTKTINSESISIVLDLGTGILKIASAVGGLLPLITLLSGALIALNFTKFVSSIEAATAAIKTFKIVIKLFAISTATEMAVATAGISLLVGAIIWMGVSLANNSNKIDKYSKSLEGLNSEISSLESNLSTAFDSTGKIRELWLEFEKLSEVLEPTADETQRLLDIQNELYGILPGINGEYDKSGNFIFEEGVVLKDLNALKSIEIELMKEELAIKRDLAKEDNEKLLLEEEKALEKLLKKRDEASEMADIYGGYANVSEGQEKTVNENLQQDELDKVEKFNDEIKVARLEVEKLQIVLGIIPERFKDVADAIDDVGDPLEEEIVSLEELATAAVTASDSVSSAASAALSLLNATSESNILNLAQVEQLKNAFPETYLQALTIEGNNIRLNTDALKNLVVMRAQDAITAQQAVVVKIEADYKEAQAALMKAEAVVSANGQVIISQEDTAFAYWKAANTSVESANAEILARKAVAEENEAALGAARGALAVAKANLGSLQSGTYWANNMADALDSQASSQSGVNEAEEAYDDLLATTIKMLKQKKKAEKDALQDQLDGYKDALQDQLDGYKKIIEARKDIIDLQQEEKDFQDELGDKNKELSDIDNELLQIQFDNSEEGTRKRLELEAEKANKVEEIGELQNNRSVDLQKDALDEEYDQYEEYIDAKIALIDDYLSKEGLIAQKAIALMKSRTDDFYKSLIDWNRTYGDGIDATIQKLWNQASAANAAVVANAAANASSYSGGSGGGGGGKEETEQKRKTKKDYNVYMIGGEPNYIEKGTGQKIESSEYSLLPNYHDGGIVGAKGSNISEVFANLMKGEVVVNKPQMADFLGSTLPSIVNSGTPIVNMEINVAGNMDKSVMPEMERMVLKTINKAWSDRGMRRSAKSFSV